MNRTQVIKLARLVKACCPSQVFDEYTPDAWELVLAAFDYDDAKQVVGELVSLPLEPGRSRYIEPGHIIAGIRRIHQKRLEAVEMPQPPAGLDPTEYRDWMRATRKAIASGTYTPRDDPPAIEGTPIPWRDLLPSLNNTTKEITA